MPIKFRCSYCRQFLGISRAQAGGVVDCPSCGRSIRVPLLDGTVQPMPSPEIDVADTHLAKALDELARLADAPVQRVVSLKSEPNDTDDNDAENQIPQPLPEPIPIEVPLPPTPIVVQPPANVAINGASGNGASEASLLAELAALSANLPDARPIDLHASEPAATRHPVAPIYSVRHSVVLLAIFLAGMLVERFVHLLESLEQKTHASSREVNAEANESQFSGRITYRTKEGESLPDKGARVLVFPQKRSGEVKLPITGFRPADSREDQLVANAALQALGGAATSADDQGRFRLAIGAGTYQLLIISHYQPNENPTPNVMLGKLLAEYFEKPDDLLGKVQYQFVPLRIKGTGDILDHAF